MQSLSPTNFPRYSCPQDRRQNTTFGISVVAVGWRGGHVAPRGLEERRIQHGVSLSTAKSRAMIQFGALMALMSLCDPNGGLVDVPLSFILKNRLHLSAEETSQFRIFASLPLYFSFLFGLMRDRMIAQRPGADRAIILYGALFSCAIYGGGGALPPTRGAGPPARAR